MKIAICRYVGMFQCVAGTVFHWYSPFFPFVFPWCDPTPAPPPPVPSDGGFCALLGTFHFRCHTSRFFGDPVCAELTTTGGCLYRFGWIHADGEGLTYRLQTTMPETNWEVLDATGAAYRDNVAR